MNIEDIQDFVDEIGYDLYLEVKDHWWCLAGNELYWFDEDVLCSETKGSGAASSDYFIINTDDGFGNSVTLVLPLNKRMPTEDFHDEYGD